MKKIIVLFLMIVGSACGIIAQLDTENADRNITSIVTVLTDTPDASNPMLCQGLVYFGDGTKNLDGTGGNFELTITVGGQTIQPSPQIITFGTEMRSSVWTSQFPVPVNAVVIIRVKSPNAADSDVDITAYLYDLFPSDVINAEVDSALDTAIPASPTKDSVNDRVKTGIIDTVESQRGWHTRQGDIFYVDPVNGATHGSGARGGRANPYLTLQDCHDNAITAWAHDLIIMIAGDTNSSTTHSIAGTTTISKAYTFIRGPGRDFIFTRTGAGDTLAITADGVEISGMQIGTAATGAGDGVDITDSDFTRIHNCWFLDTRGDGIHILRGNNGRYHNNHFEGTGVGGTGQGIHIVGTAGTSNDNAIFDSHFANTAGDSIIIEQGITLDTSIHHNQIHDSVAWGINIGASSVDALVHDNFFGNNASGNITDSGTTTIQSNNEQWATIDGSIPADMYTDITTTPWQEVYHEIGNVSNEYYRDNLYTANGTPIISDRLKIGKRVRE